MGEQTWRSFICLGGPLRYATSSSECYATDAARTPSASGATVFAARFINKPANPCIDNRPSQNLSGAYVHVPGFWCGPELDRFVWDKDCGGIVNEGRTQNLPAVLTARLPACRPKHPAYEWVLAVSPRWWSSRLPGRSLRRGRIRPMIDSTLAK